MFNIEELKSRIDPQLSYKFRVQEIRITDSTTIPSIYVESVNFSYDDIQLETVSFQNRYIKFAGRAVSPPVNIEFYEDNNSSIQKALNTWRSLVRRSDGTYNYPSVYKKNMTILIYGLDRSKSTLEEVVVSKLRLVEAFPTNVNPLRLSYADGNRLIVSQTFEVNEVQILEVAPPGRAIGTAEVPPVQ